MPQVPGHLLVVAGSVGSNSYVNPATLKPGLMLMPEYDPKTLGGELTKPLKVPYETA